jgi:hypothetical protein
VPSTRKLYQIPSLFANGAAFFRMQKGFAVQSLFAFSLYAASLRRG